MKNVKQTGTSSSGQREEFNHNEHWTFFCCRSKITDKNWLNAGSWEEIYLKESDIEGVMVETNIGNEILSINDRNTGLNMNIHTDIDLSPIILLLRQGDSFEMM